MPFNSRGNYQSSEALPDHLKHKPVYALPYEHFDGEYAGDTDALYLTVGLAQYDPDKVSVKVMRYIESGRWSRESEETPVHRVIDLTILLAKALYGSQNKIVTIPKSTFANQNSEIIISPEQRTYGQMASYNAYLAEKGDFIKERLNKLADTLNELKNEGLI
jgi:hypothetical protein